MQLIFQAFTYRQSRFLWTILKQKDLALKLRPASIYHASAPEILEDGCRNEAGTPRVKTLSPPPKATLIHPFLEVHRGVLKGHREWVLTSGKTEYIVNWEGEGERQMK